MKNYKAEIKNLVHEAILSGEDYDGNAERYSDKILSLIREIVQEATKMEPPSYNGEGITVRYDERNKVKKKILSNVEELIK